MPTIEQIEAAADLLTDMASDGSWQEKTDQFATYFLRTAGHLRQIADGRKPKPPKVFVEGDGDEYVVRVLPAGSDTHAAVYVYNDIVHEVVRQRSNVVLDGEQIWGPTK